MTQFTRFAAPPRRYLTARARRMAEEGLRKGLEHVLRKAQEIVPHREGTLERSGRVVQDGLDGAVTFDTVYARRQHEELTWRHAPGREAKYLEKPMASERQVVLQLMAVPLRRWLRGG